MTSDRPAPLKGSVATAGRERARLLDDDEVAALEAEADTTDEDEDGDD